ncbi:M23 family metallopeptidase [uncultured Alistipes sp.]|uniref:M23 family metallopeptidase n=1 Tax=uncultured Alistipes sp. TaxID=538949 RepID=UPI00259AAF23|nr:M23 family metallopeptidase [uncultured Alistipes sp.]
MRRLLTILLLTALTAGARGQTLDPADYLYPIRDVDGTCSSNFGEIRPGHFHAGVDIRTGGTEGKELVAVADGHVSRLSVSPGGYGRAIYLTLNNGTTAVYGHLQRFRDDIEQLVAQERRAQGKNSLNLFFGHSKLPVRQGEVIGYSGNSGSSSGPHLHFEIRDTRTQRLYNVVREGIIRPVDSLPPRIVKIHYVEIDTLPGGLCARKAPESYTAVRSHEGTYRLNREEPLGAGRKGYFVAEITDRRNGVHNRFGLWRVTAWADGERYYEYRMDGFTFAQSRCCDAVSHYPIQIATRNEAFRLAQAEAAPDCFYTAMTDRGIIRTVPGQLRRIRIEAEDDSGNRSQIEFDIRGREEEFRATADTLARIVRPGHAATLTCGKMTARIPAGALHETLACRPEQTAAPRVDTGLVALSPAYRALPPATPLRKTMSVSIRTEIPARMRPHAVLARRTAQGRAAYVGGSCKEGVVTASTYTSDPLFVVADLVPPRITASFGRDADLSQSDAIGFRATDNFSGIAAYTLLIDGQWVPCERYPMTGRLFHTFDTPPTRNRHTVRLTVRDGAGNTASWEGTFYR